MNDIYNLITSISKRPKMYVKEEKIEYIFYLLLGYQGAMAQKDNDSIESHFSGWFEKWLIEWIKKNIDESYEQTSFYWYDDIKAITNNSQDECKLFYQLVELFFEDYEECRGDFEWRKNK